MRVLLASSEVFPFAKTGGLADVAGALPKALQKLGVDVRVIMPKYKGIEEKEFPITYGGLRISCPISQRIVDAEIVESRYNGIPVYLVDKDEYYYRDNLYSTQDGDYIDNAERFIFFSKAILEATKVTGFAPHVIHCNDWETALVPVFLRALYRQDPLLSRIATLLTIHNLGYQGLFWHLDWHLLNLPWEYFTPSSLEFYGKINFLKGGVVFTDVLNTVSKKYSEEIQTPEFGSGLDGILRTRKDDLYGIVNGIDYDDWNPQKDPYIPAAFDADHLDKKGVCKAELQRAFGLPVDATIPVVSSISRLADQKGFDLVSEGFEKLLSHNIQYILLGTGERKYHELFTELARKYPRGLFREDHIRQCPCAPHRSGLRHVPHALPVRAVRSQPALQSQVRHGSHCPRRRRPGRHDQRRSLQPGGADRLQVPRVFGRRHVRGIGAGSRCIQEPQGVALSHEEMHGARLFVGEVRRSIHGPLRKGHATT